MGLVLEVRYHEQAGLRRDFEAQLRLGGLYAAVEPPPGTPVGAPVQMVLRLGNDEVVRIETHLVSSGVGVMLLELPPSERERVAAAIDVAAPSSVLHESGATDATVPDVLLMELDDEEAGPLPALDLAPPADEWVVEAAEEHPEGEGEGEGDGDGTVTIFAEVPDEIPEPGLVIEIEKEQDAKRATRVAQLLNDPNDQRPLGMRIMAMNMGDKIRLALCGDSDARAHLMKERASAVQLSLLKNPKLGLDEVVFLARSPLISADVVEMISRHQFYGKSTVIAAALVRNPKTPLSMAVQLVNKLVMADLRSVAKGAGVRNQIAAAARKRLAGVG